LVLPSAGHETAICCKKVGRGYPLLARIHTLPVQSDLTASARIRNAALEGFAKNGVAATSIRDVAAVAGVSAGLVQHHFSTKDELRRAVNDHVIALAREAFADLPEIRVAQDLQHQIGDRVAAFVRDQPAALRYVARSVADGDEDALEIFDSFIEIATNQWRHMADQGVLRPDADPLWAALHVVVLNLGTVLLGAAIDRHLPEPFFSPRQIERWNKATNALFIHGLYQPGGDGGP
jgi:AcrR family transcriptional regulator